jgi:hypothetical protein
MLQEELNGDIFRRQDQGGGLEKSLEWKRIRGVVLRRAPTHPQSKLTFNLDGYGKKGSITVELCGAIFCVRTSEGLGVLLILSAFSISFSKKLDHP